MLVVNNVRILVICPVRNLRDQGQINPVGLDCCMVFKMWFVCIYRGIRYRSMCSCIILFSCDMQQVLCMEEGAGVWSISGPSSWADTYYQFEVIAPDLPHYNPSAERLGDKKFLAPLSGSS